MTSSVDLLRGVMVVTWSQYRVSPGVSELSIIVRHYACNYSAIIIIITAQQFVIVLTSPHYTAEVSKSMTSSLDLLRGEMVVTWSLSSLHSMGCLLRTSVSISFIIKLDCTLLQYWTYILYIYMKCEK